MEKFFKSKETSLWITFVSILVLVFKTAPVFQQLSFPNPHTGFYGVMEWIISFVSVTVIEIAILLFISRGNRIESYFFAIVSFLSSVYYFNGLYFTDFRLNVMQIAWSLLYPFVIVRFSHFYNSMLNSEDGLLVELQKMTIDFDKLKSVYDATVSDFEITATNVKTQFEQLKAENKELNHAFLEQQAKQKELVEQLKTVQNELKQAIEQRKKSEAETIVWKTKLTCQHCGETFDTTQALAGHKKGCKSPTIDIQKSVFELVS